MKNLLVYISPDKNFIQKYEWMLEVQIKNSLDYWKKEDIIIVTNFPYEYAGMKSLEVPNLINSQYYKNSRAIMNSKINVIIYLLENKIITEPTWFHDLDAFQVSPLNLVLEKDLALVCYGVYYDKLLQDLGKDYKDRINFGSIFFKPESLDIFKVLLERMDKNKHYEEEEMTIMYGENINNIRDRIKLLDQSYNIGTRCTNTNIKLAERPLKIFHFPPYKKRWLNKIGRFLPNKLRRLLKERFTSAVLVTGANGYLATAIIEYLKKKNYAVIGTGIDVRNKRSMISYFKDAYFVFHTAAKVGKVSDKEYYDVNVLGTKNVAELCMEHDCKMIHFGTVATEHGYGKTKQEAQELVEELTKKGLKALTLKLNTIYSKEMIPTPGVIWYPLEKLVEDTDDIIKHHNFDKYQIHEKPTNLHQSKP